jgi:hypothetical protein
MVPVTKLSEVSNFVGAVSDWVVMYQTISPCGSVAGWGLPTHLDFPGNQDNLGDFLLSHFMSRNVYTSSCKMPSSDFNQNCNVFQL